MPQVASRALALRVGWFGPDPESEPAAVAARAGFAELPLAGDDNPCALHALLALADEPSGPDGAREVLENLRNALRRESPPDPRHVEETLPESLAAAHVWAREPRPGVRPKVSLSFICARAGRYFVAQAPGMPVYLLRPDGLRPMAGDLPRLRGGDDDLEPEVVSGVLEDGDALVVCSQSVHEALSDRQLREILVHATGPETAVRRLVSEARKEGARNPQAALLFAGVGPAVAYRLRAPIAAVSESRPFVAADPSRREGSRTGMVALFGALAGATIGVLIGVAVTLSLAGSHQTPGGEPQSFAPGTAITPLSMPSQTAEATVPTPPAPKAANPLGNTPGNAPPANGPVGNAPVASGGNAPLPGVNGPLTPAVNPAVGNAPAPAVLQGPSNGVRTAALPVEPPRHTLAAGLAGGGRLILKVDSAAGRFTAETTQGILYSPPSNQGAPVGEPLAASLAELLRDQPVHGELRLVNGEETVASLGGTALEKFLHGESATLGPLRAGEYRLCWWNSDTSALSGPVTTLRLAGF